MHGTLQEHHQPSMFLDQPAAVQAIYLLSIYCGVWPPTAPAQKNDSTTLQEETYQPRL